MGAIQIQAIDLRPGDRLKVMTYTSIGRQKRTVLVDSVETISNLVRVIDDDGLVYDFSWADVVTLWVSDG